MVYNISLLFMLIIDNFKIVRECFQGWKLLIFSTCPLEKYQKNLPVRRVIDLSIRKSQT